MAPFIVGFSLIRGTPTPVVNLAALLGDGGDAKATRFVTIRTGSRVVAISVESVIGVRDLSALQVHDLPPLLRDASPAMVVGIGSLDADLLVVVGAGHIITESAWVSLQEQVAA